MLTQLLPLRKIKEKRDQYKKVTFGTYQPKQHMKLDEKFTGYFCKKIGHMKKE